MTGPVGHHVNDENTSVCIGLHIAPPFRGMVPFDPLENLRVRENVTVYYNNFSGIFQGVMKKNMTIFLGKYLFSSVHIFKKKISVNILTKPSLYVIIFRCENTTH